MLGFSDAFHFLFPAHSLTNLWIIESGGTDTFYVCDRYEPGLSVLKIKINETLVISHAGILVLFFLGIFVFSYWVYEEYAADQTCFLPFALFIGISGWVSPPSGIGAYHSFRNGIWTKTPLGTLTSLLLLPMTMWWLAFVGSGYQALPKREVLPVHRIPVGWQLVYIMVMFGSSPVFLKKVGRGVCPTGEAINKHLWHLFCLFLLFPLVWRRLSVFTPCLSFMAGWWCPIWVSGRWWWKSGRYFFSLLPLIPFAFHRLRTGNHR